MKIVEKITQELGLKTWQTETVIRLIDEGNMIPFIARYRKEATGAMHDDVLRAFDERLRYLRNLEERKETILASIEEQGKLTAALRKEIEEAETAVKLESKHLDDGIFEIRGKVGTDISRVMYFFYYGGRIILTNGFIKKTQKTPKSEIERAKQYRKDFLEREGESDENTGSVFE